MTNDRISLNVADRMNRGLAVFDAEGGKVGTVDDYDSAMGYMMVRPNPFSDRLLYVPFSIITHIDPREVYVSESAADVRRHYANPPPRDALVDERVDPETGEDDSRAVIIEPSGYDGEATVAEVSKIGQLAGHIAPGFQVYTGEMEHFGRVNLYDRERRQLMVMPDRAPWHSVAVPLALVDGVDEVKGNVYLAVSEADLKRYPRVGAWNLDGDAQSQLGEDRS